MQPVGLIRFGIARARIPFRQTQARGDWILSDQFQSDLSLGSAQRPVRLKLTEEDAT